MNCFLQLNLIFRPKILKAGHGTAAMLKNKQTLQYDYLSFRLKLLSSRKNLPARLYVYLRFESTNQQKIDEIIKAQKISPHYFLSRAT